MIPDVEILAKQLATDLYGSRKAGKSGPENPVNATKICGAYKVEHDWNVTDREIRAATKFLVEQKVPIGTTLDGCYYVLSSKEWEPTLSMLLPKFISIKRKIDAIQEMQKEMAAKEAGQEEIPMMKILTKNLDLERIK
jgi:hypothetical protein